MAGSRIKGKARYCQDCCRAGKSGSVDMFPYKKTELFQESGFRSKPPKKPGNTILSGT